MINYNFWNDWKSKTIIEKRAINAIRRARKYIIESLPKNNLVAIYIKGSFVRREMNNKSDIDMVPVVTENKYEGKVFGVNGREIFPVMVVPLSLQEFEKNELHSKGNYSPDLRAKPDRFLRKLSEHKLICGRHLNQSKFPIRSDKELLKEKIMVIKNGYIPAYKSKKIDFITLLKEIFWLTEAEQNARGLKFKSSFEGISNSVKNKNHIVHEAMFLRLNPPKNNKTKKEFVLKLEKYLSDLHKKP